MSFIGSLFQSETIPLLESGLGFAYQKQLTIMNNIANVETPGYKRQTVPEKEFMRLLEEAIDERSRVHPSRFSIRNASHISFIDNHYPVVRRINGKEWGPERHDENSVVPEKEMVDLAKNTMAIQLMQQLLRKKLGMMRSSLRDRVV